MLFLLYYSPGCREILGIDKILCQGGDAQHVHAGLLLHA